MTYRTVEQLVNRSEVIALPGTATVREASKLMAEHHIGAVLVMAEDQLQGIFTERDLLIRVLARDKNPDETEISEVMTRNLVTVLPETTAVDALRLMNEVGFRHLPIVEGGDVHGIISLRDFIGAEFQLAGES